MASAKDTATFFQHGTAAQFDHVLNLYPQALKLKAERKSKKPEELVKLDNWWVLVSAKCDRNYTQPGGVVWSMTAHVVIYTLRCRFPFLANVQLSRALQIVVFVSFLSCHIISSLHPLWQAEKTYKFVFVSNFKSCGFPLNTLKILHPNIYFLFEKFIYII